MYKLSQEEFIALRGLISELSGIHLDNGKEYLIETRLKGLLEELGLTSFIHLYRVAKEEKDKIICQKIIDAVSTNETMFFRDIWPFELIKHKIMPDLIDKRSERTDVIGKIPIRIWCMACSTGQEVYSTAIILKELFLDPKKYDIYIMGTDISSAAVAKASYGEYNKFEVTRGLSPERLNRYFSLKGENYKVKDEIRSMVVFKKLNLLEPFMWTGKYDIILFRNVAIYFNPKDRAAMYEKIANVIAKDGYLIIGSTESLTNETDLFKPYKYLRSIFYQLK